jgi:hypothetical protein
VIKFTSSSISAVSFNTINNLHTQPDMCVLRSGQMKKLDLAHEANRGNGGAAGHAADELNRVVNRIIRTLRSGRPARLPGLGTITPGREWTFLPERNDP